ncbi:hypothetical protein RsoM2USA_330 [Ralstonia phage RsoM2USA]|nr:hypothetical protein RsoM2USA_330 [Ralstonia phage RsoM2USA]
MKLNDIARMQLQNNVAGWINAQNRSQLKSLDSYVNSLNGKTLDLINTSKKLHLEGKDKNSNFIYPIGFDVHVNFLFIHHYDLSNVNFSWLTLCEDLDFNYCQIGNLLNHPEKFNISGLECVSLNTHINDVDSIIGIFQTDLQLSFNFQDAFEDGDSLYITRDGAGNMHIRKFKPYARNTVLAEPKNEFDLQDWLVSNNFENLA